MAWSCHGRRTDNLVRAPALSDLLSRLGRLSMRACARRRSSAFFRAGSGGGGGSLNTVVARAAMAQNVQNVTLSLTLPITCHICLGKVRQPVICVNYHVFCSVCIEVWLKNNNQCPACRVPITPENPCKEIIGGTGENECIFTHTVRKHLRKTRLELLHKEYEDEIESLEKEVEELKGKNFSLESQLKIVLDPQSLATSTESDGSIESADQGKSSIDPKTLDEWTKKLKAANEISVKMKDDVEKLKEVNKKLRTENSGFVRENMRLKAEVDSRSPQKFGRFTVAALQSKVDQHERESNRLKKALERSDEYIEELENQVTQLKRAIEEHEMHRTSDGSAEKGRGDGEEGTSLKSQEESTEETILSPSQSSDNIEQPTLSGLQDDNSMMCLNSSSQDNSNGSESHCPMDKDMFAGSQDLPHTATTVMNATLRQAWENKIDDYTPSKEVCEFPTQDTPTMSLSSLQLNTPNNTDSPSKDGKASTYLRKLMFDDFPCAMASVDNGDSTEKESGSVRETLAYVTKNKTLLWNCSRTNYAQTFDFETSDPALEFDRSDQSVRIPQSGKQSALSSDKACQFLFERLQAISDAEINCTRTTSEASMDAAYLDKITELDSMMSESDSSKSPYRFRLGDLANTSKFSQRAKFCETEKTLERTEVNTEKCPESSNETSNSEEWKPVAFSVLSPSSLHMNEHFPLFSDEPLETDEVTSQKCYFEKDQPSPSFLFESRKLDADLPSDSSLFNVCMEENDPLVQSQSSWAASFLPKERSRSNSYSAKRKIQSSLSSASPSKSSKS